jgi:hypothetical protein
MEMPAVRTELYELGVVTGLIGCEVLQEFAGGEVTDDLYHGRAGQSPS